MNQQTTSVYVCYIAWLLLFYRDRRRNVVFGCHVVLFVVNVVAKQLQPHLEASSIDRQR